MPTTPKPISLMLEKTTLADADLIEIVDSAETNLSLKNKKVQFSNFKAAAVAPTEDQWTPSELNVTITVNSAYWIKQNRIVSIQFDLTWPTTTDTNNVTLSGLPSDKWPLQNPGDTFPTQYFGSLWHYDSAGFANSVTSNVCQINPSGNIYLRGEWAAYTGFKLQNVDLSGKRVLGSMTYISAT